MRAYVLIPGAGGDSFYSHLVTERLRARGHEVVAPDLPPPTRAPGEWWSRAGSARMST